jgi:hypothetical protein
MSRSGRQAFEQKLEALTALRRSDAASVEAPLRRALADPNGYYVSRAAALVEHHALRTLAPDLVTAFDRFLADDPVKSDPQCWAKNAIVSALHTLEYRPAAVYLRGIRHVQPEPGRGGQYDSAGPLRGRCALALVDSDLAPRQILLALTDLLVDLERAARLDAVRAVARLAQPESALLIRLKALTGDEHADVMRECLLSLMTLAPTDSVQFVSRFLDPNNELLCGDAAEALASARRPEALAALLDFLRRQRMPISTRRSVILTLAASPLPEAGEYLVSVIATEPVEAAEAAITALGASRFREEHKDRVAALVQGRASETLRNVLETAFSGFGPK